MKKNRPKLDATSADPLNLAELADTWAALEVAAKAGDVRAANFLLTFAPFAAGRLAEKAKRS